MNEERSSAALTRRKLLEVAAEEILLNGFRSTCLDRILEKAGITKGALYYHFKNKKELGLAMIDEIYRDQMIDRWRTGLSRTGDPVDDLIAVLQEDREACTSKSIRCGCPINNLAQEMAAVDEEFRLKIESIFSSWRDAISEALERGKKNGKVRENVDTLKAAIFITALIEGATGASKNAQDPLLKKSAIETLQLFIQTLRPGCYIRAAAVA